MHSPDGFARHYADRAGTRLISLYALALCWYVLVVSLLSTLGVEPIYQNVTPFYAVWIPITRFASANSLGILALLLTLASLSATLNPNGVRMRRLVALTIVATGLTALLVAGDRARRGMTFADAASQVVWFAPPLLLIVAITTFVARWLKRSNWWADESTKQVSRKLLVGMVFVSFAYAGCIAMLRGGPEGISHAYSRTTYEYVDDIGKGLTLFGFIRDYNELHPHLSMHAKVHPPGPVVLLWIMSSIVFTRDPMVLSLGTMLVGSLGIIPLFLWVRDMINQRVALTCSAFYALMPSITLFTATSADILFMPLIFLTMPFFWRAIHRRSLGYAVGAGAMYAVLSLTSFSLLTLGAFFAFVGLWRLQASDIRNSVIKTAVVMLVSFLGLHLAVRFTTGFDIVECFRLSHAQFQEDQAHLDVLSPRYPSWAFKLFNPLCWIYFAGIPTTLLFVWRLIKPTAATKALFLTFGFTLLVIVPLYLARGEGERSAMYVLPFIVIPAAHLVDELGAAAKSFSPLAATFGFLVVQTWITETYLYTYW